MNRMLTPTWLGVRQLDFLLLQVMLYHSVQPQESRQFWYFQVPAYMFCDIRQVYTTFAERQIARQG